MALEYKSPIDLKVVMHVLDDHMLWYGKIVKGYFENKPYNEEFPVSFKDWLLSAQKEELIDAHVAEKLNGIYRGLIDAANIFISKCDVFGEPPLKEYSDFTKHYEEFIQAMRRIERDQAVENSGYDNRTGLRSIRMMRDDIDIEMQRRSRQGSPFAIALLKIINFNEEWRESKDTIAPVIQKISKQIRVCLRAFDDAYYLGDEYFLLSLKQADMIGAESAMGRLNSAIKAVHIALPHDDMDNIKVSAVVFEPTIAENLDTLISNMKKDIEAIGEKVAVVKYNELSPIQRYVRDVSVPKS